MLQRISSDRNSGAVIVLNAAGQEDAMGIFSRMGKSKRPKTLKFKVDAEIYGRLLSAADSAGKSLELTLHDAILLYLDRAQASSARTVAEPDSAAAVGIAEAASMQGDGDKASVQNEESREKSELLALDYDDVRAEPRQSRLFWGG